MSQGLINLVISEGVTSIGSAAFGYCENLTSMTIPNSVTDIGDDAFSECSKIVLSVSEGSYAEQYAKESSIPYVLAAE